MTGTGVAGTQLVVRDGLFLTMDPDRPEPYLGWMEVGGDGRIAAMGEGSPSPTAAPVLDAQGALVTPGFVSAHSHLFTSGLRGLGLDQSLYGWIEAITRPVRAADSEDLYWLTRHGALDFLSNGITSAYDFCHGLLDFEAESPGRASFGGALRPIEHLEAQITAKVDAGLRFVNSVPLDDAAGSRDDVLGRLDHVVAFADKHRGHPCYLGSAISGAVQWAAEPATAELEVEAMRRHGLINQAHFLETPHEIERQREKFAWYRDAGALGSDLLFGHFVQATDAQIVEVAAAGCGMVWQPMSNGRLASGVADVGRCRELGMRVGVGVDDQACTDVSDPFQSMRFGIFVQRAMRKDPAAMAVRDMLELHTRESARVLGVDADVGSLEVGKYADFLVVDPRSPDTGPVWDAYGTYVLACGLRNLKQVWVGGELVAEEGRIVSGAGDETSREVHRRLARLAGR